MLGAADRGAQATRPRPYHHYVEAVVDDRVGPAVEAALVPFVAMSLSLEDPAEADLEDPVEWHVTATITA